MRAIQYIRWSSKKQGRGSTLSRQKEAVEAYCAERGWPIVDVITDAGASGWDGENMFLGELAALHSRLQLEGGHDLVVVCETLDRLSRFKPMSVIRFMDSMTRTGVSIALADKDILIDARSLDDQTEQLKELVDDLDRARREGDVRSARSRGSWNAIRAGQAVKVEQDCQVIAVEDATWGDATIGLDVTVLSRGREKVYEISEQHVDLEVGTFLERDDPIGVVRRKVHTSGTCPAWLSISPCRRAFGRATERENTLRVIFERYADGISFRDICRELNAAGVATWRGGNGWQSSAIKALVGSRSVLGEYQHQSRATGETIGSPDPFYFPQVIDDDLFQRANDLRLRRVMKGRGRKIAHRNLLGTLAVCGACGSRMRFNRKPERGGDLRGRTYYQCGGYDLRRGCSVSKMHNGNKIEVIILDRLLNLALDDQHFSNAQDVTSLVADLASQRRLMEGAQAKVRRLGQGMALVDDPSFLVGEYNAAMVEVARLESAIKEKEEALTLARGAVAPGEHIRRVADVRDDMLSADEGVAVRARKTVASALHDLIAEVAFHASGAVTVTVREGKRVLTIRADSTVSDFDLHHPWRPISSKDPAMLAYLRRTASLRS